MQNTITHNAILESGIAFFTFDTFVFEFASCTDATHFAVFAILSATRTNNSSAVIVCTFSHRVVMVAAIEKAATTPITRHLPAISGFACCVLNFFEPKNQLSCQFLIDLGLIFFNEINCIFNERTHFCMFLVYSHNATWCIRTILHTCPGSRP